MLFFAVRSPRGQHFYVADTPDGSAAAACFFSRASRSWRWAAIDVTLEAKPLPLHQSNGNNGICALLGRDDDFERSGTVLVRQMATLGP